MSTVKDLNIDLVIERIKKLKNLRTLDEIADFLGIVHSTFRNRKSRNAIPYEEIVEKLSAEELSYVMKGQEITVKEDPVIPDNVVSEPESQYEKARRVYKEVQESRVGQIVEEKDLARMRSELGNFIEWIKDMEKILEGSDTDKIVNDEQLWIEYKIMKMRIKEKANGL